MSRFANVERPKEEDDTRMRLGCKCRRVEPKGEFETCIELHEEDDLGNLNDVLNWWRSKSSKFPVLSTKAFEFLQVPASGAKIESMFSEVKHTFRPSRQRLNILSELLVVKSYVRSTGTPFTQKDINDSLAESDLSDSEDEHV